MDNSNWSSFMKKKKQTWMHEMPSMPSYQTSKIQCHCDVESSASEDPNPNVTPQLGKTPKLESLFVAFKNEELRKKKDGNNSRYEFES